MSHYKRVLLAVDFQSDNLEIIEKVQQVTRDNNAELLLVHVNEPINPAFMADGMSNWGGQVASLETDIRRESTKKLKDLSDRLGVSADLRFFCEGRPANSIHEVVDENEVDLVVLGTHGQHGLQLLLGSTANAVLHGANCDVLAVRVKKEA